MNAKQRPEQWNLLLQATNRKDYETAREICRRNGFDRDSQPEIRQMTGTTYYAQSDKGEVFFHTNSAELSRMLGKSPSYVTTIITKKKGEPIDTGPMKGWTIWKE